MKDPHDEWEALAVGHVMAALEPGDENLFATHLRACDRCARTVAEMTSVASHLAYAAEPAGPPAALKTSIMDAVRATSPLASGGGRSAAEPVRVLRPRGTSSSPAWGRILSMAAGLVLVVGLGVWNVNLQQNVDLSRQTIARMARVERLAADPSTVKVPMTSGTGVHGTALVRGAEVAVLVNGLPRNEPSSIYVLWYQDRSGTFRAFDTFDVREPDHVNVVETKLDRQISAILAIAVSREQGRVAPATPSAPLMLGRTTEGIA